MALCGLQDRAVAQVTSESWKDSDATKTPPNNNWSDGNNWSGGVAPNGSNYSADVPLLSFPFTFPTMDIPVTLDHLTDELGTYTSISSGVTLTLTGQSLSGGLLLNYGGGSAASVLVVNNNTLTYTSTTGANCCLQMFNQSGILGTGTATLINEGTITYGTGISGTAGQIGPGLTVQNLGNIYSGQNSLLALNANANWTNQGTIESANHFSGDCLGGSIVINGGTITQQSPGQLFASSGTINLENNATIIGGSLSTGCSGSGVIHTTAVNSSTLNNVTIQPGSFYQSDSPSTTSLVGTITNNGTMTILNTTTKGASTTTLSIPSAVTLTGTGSVVLGGGYNSQINGTGPLTNQQLITGQGTINVSTLINQGTISAADGNGNNTLTIKPGIGGLTNTGTITADPTSIAEISGGTVTNTGGIISSGSGNALLDTGVTITGGNIIGGAPLAGPYVEGKLATLSGTSTNPLTISGVLQLNNGDTCALEGTIVNNGEIIQTSYNAATQLKIPNTTTVSGTGSIVFANDSPFDQLIGTGLSDRLNLNNNVQGNVAVDDLTVVLGSKNTWETGPSAGQPTVFGPSSLFSIQGTFQADPNTTTDIQGGISNYNPTTKTWTGGYLDLVGGTLDIGGGRPILNWNGKLLLGSSTSHLLTGGVNALDTITNFSKNSNVTVGSTAELNLNGPETFSGTVDIQNGGLYLQGSGSLTQTSGKTTVDGTLTLPSAQTWSILGGSVFGTGTVNGDEALGATSGTTTATETVGDSSTSPGTFHINGTFTQNAEGKIIFVITPTATSQLDVTGDTTLGGNVTCTVQKGYTVPHGYMQIVLTAPQITGTWATNSGCAAEGIQINYSSTEIIFKKP